MNEFIPADDLKSKFDVSATSIRSRLPRSDLSSAEAFLKSWSPITSRRRQQHFPIESPMPFSS